jgi:hypothetical protein
MQRIEIDDDMYGWFEAHVKGFETPNAVLRREVLGIRSHRTVATSVLSRTGALYPLIQAGSSRLATLLAAIARGRAPRTAASSRTMAMSAQTWVGSRLRHPHASSSSAARSTAGPTGHTISPVISCVTSEPKWAAERAHAAVFEHPGTPVRLQSKPEPTTGRRQRPEEGELVG